MIILRPGLLIKKLARPVGAWLGFSGLYAMTAGSCPFCGQISCPGGVLTAGIAGSVLTFLLFSWRRLSQGPAAMRFRSQQGCENSYEQEKETQ